MLWLLFLFISILSGISTIVFIILFAMKKKHAVLGLSISGGIALLSLGAFMISGSISAFNALSTIDTSVSYEDDVWDDEDDYWDVDEDYWDEEDDVASFDEDEDGDTSISDDPNKSKLLDFDSDEKLTAGSYKVGDEVPAGEYLVVGEEYGYIEATKDSSGDTDSILFNDLLDEGDHTYVTLTKGDYFNFKNAVMYPVKDAPSVKPENGIYKDGMFKVGEDIPAGEYKVFFDQDKSSREFGFIEVSEDSKHNIDSVVHNDLIETDAYVTVKKGQYITLQAAYIEVK